MLTYIVRNGNCYYKPVQATMIFQLAPLSLKLKTIINAKTDAVSSFILGSKNPIVETIAAQKTPLDLQPPFLIVRQCGPA